MSNPTIRMPVCPNCGTPPSHGESYCRNCGKQLVAPTVASPQVPPRYTDPTQARPSSPPQSTVTAVAPGAPHMQGGPQFQSGPPINVGRKKRSSLLLGCLIILGLGVVAIGAGGIYIWRSNVYSPPDRQAPAIPERAAGTMTEFPVDNDPNAPATPTSVKTEILGGTLAKSGSDTSTKLPPGVDRTKLAKGATSMTSSTYKPKPKGSSTTTSSSGGDVNVFVLTAMPNQPTFGTGLATSIVQATGGTKTGVRVTSPSGAVYVGSKIKSSQDIVYVLTKQSSDICILIYSDDPSNQAVVDRLAQNVGNGQGLIDYPEIKDSLWTLPVSTPPGLTLVEINTITGTQIENQIARSSGGGDEVQKILSEMRAFIPDKLTGARYIDESKREWVSLNFEYGSSFGAWKTWLLARGALGLGGAQSTTVRNVNGLYMDQEGMRILIFQKGPYLIFLSSPSGSPIDRLVALGNQFQV